MYKLSMAGYFWKLSVGDGVTFVVGSIFHVIKGSQNFKYQTPLVVET